MVAISRRSFVEKLGLGAGAMLLSPIAQTLVNEARGQASTRKIAWFFMVGNGIHPDWNFTPAEFKPGGLYSVPSPVLNGPTSYTWPAMWKTLEPYRNRMLLVDGLANESKIGDGGHSMRFSALSGMPSGNGLDPEEGTPGGITIDQFIANKIGVTTPRKSVLFGVTTKPEPLYANLFASGKDKPEPQFQSPQVMFTDVFGGAAAPDPSGVPASSGRHRILFDTLRADIKRLQSALVAPERQKLDSYLAAIDEFEARQKMLGAVTSSCGAPVPPAPAGATKPPADDLFESMHNMATLALTCGITNVVGSSLGCGFSHDTFPELKKVLIGSSWEGMTWKGGWGNIGHMDQPIRQPVIDILYQWCGRLLARTIETLKTIKVGDKTLFDESVFLVTSENAEEHHAKHQRWPLALIGNAGGKLKVDGRFIRYQKKELRATTGFRTMTDLFCTLATAMGAPTTDFGKGGNEPVFGPLELLVA